jgi:hypothetical protein
MRPGARAPAIHHPACALFAPHPATPHPTLPPSPGGDSGIGRAVALHFAREGAHVAVLYLDEHDDAKATEAAVAKEGRKCLLFAGDVGDEKVGCGGVQRGR